ncbi:hypothetical protein PR202_gb05184 [Eleusine coracana subsp. coracana]|uniref:Uncharacterized protein n=1 Tax=Eleusine coracana subsp. coracana TaxID=191504 RepID=A0AAV5E5Z3_ELECO|nr:hypothetical protein QOZ80_1BG0079000 [Eleusine coracana subsp. coracana]GJN18065.1 hypothetical protein PR202_gb05184 [Eleusine coracana subsp. coracana]
MGNTVPKPKRTCHKAGTTAAGTEGKRSESAAAEAEAPTAPMRVIVQHDDEREEELMIKTRAGRRCLGVSWARGGASSAGTRGVTVKILMRRKDAEALVARLHAQSARTERKTRMVELKRQLRAAGDDPATLAPVQENQWYL